MWSTMFLYVSEISCVPIFCGEKLYSHQIWSKDGSEAGRGGASPSLYGASSHRWDEVDNAVELALQRWRIADIPGTSRNTKQSKTLAAAARSANAFLPNTCQLQYCRIYYVRVEEHLSEVRCRQSMIDK